MLKRHEIRFCDEPATAWGSGRVGAKTYSSDLYAL